MFLIDIQLCNSLLTDFLISYKLGSLKQNLKINYRMSRCNNINCNIFLHLTLLKNYLLKTALKFEIAKSYYQFNIKEAWFFDWLKSNLYSDLHSIII